jgi:GTPase SAR1 family protein
MSSSLKVVILGDPGVGKTTAIRAFAEHVSALTGTDQTATAIDDGADAAAPLVHLAGMRDRVQGLKLVPLELRGGAQVVFCECSARAAAASFASVIAGAYCVVIAYDVCDYKSYHAALTRWNAELQRHGYAGAVVLLGCKMDLTASREVHSNEAGKYASRFKMGFMEMSSTRPTNVRHAFRLIMNCANTRTAAGTEAQSSPSPSLSSSSPSASAAPLAAPAALAASTAASLTAPSPLAAIATRPSPVAAADVGRSRASPVAPLRSTGGSPAVSAAGNGVKLTLMRRFDHTVQISSSYDSINAIIGRTSMSDQKSSPALPMGFAGGRAGGREYGDEKVGEAKNAASSYSSSSVQPQDLQQHEQQQQRTMLPDQPSRTYAAAKSSASGASPGVASTYSSVSPPRALFAQEYQKMVHLFKECGVEATDGFLDHIKQKEIGREEEDVVPTSAASPAAAALNGSDIRSPRTRLQSVTPSDVQGIQNMFSQASMLGEQPRTPRSGPSTLSSPTFVSDDTMAGSAAAAAKVPLSFSTAAFASSSSTSASPPLMSKVSPLMQHSMLPKGTSKNRVWGQHVVPGSTDDMSATERIGSIKIKRSDRRRVREVDGEKSVPMKNAAAPSGEGAAASGSSRVPDFYLDVDMPGGGKAKLAVRMDTRPRGLAEEFVRAHPGLRQRMVPILSDKINERMEKFRENKRRKRFARLHRRRRDMLARWKTPTAAGEPNNNKGEQKGDKAAQKTSSEPYRKQKQLMHMHADERSAAARVRGPIVAKLHVQIAADSKQTINIRKGDRAEDLAAKFSHKYGLKPRDKDIVSKRLEQEIRRLHGRHVRGEQKASYGSGGGSTGQVRANQSLRGMDIPDNLTPAQRELLIQTMGGGVALPTPWKEPPAAAGARIPAATVPVAAAHVPLAVEERVPILRMKITLPSGGTDRLAVMEGDDLNVLAQNFVAKHALSSESVSSLHKLLRSELARKEKKNKMKKQRRIKAAARQ